MAPLAILPVLLLLTVPAPASSNAFTEFRIPDHSWLGGNLNARASGSWSTDGDSYGETRRSSLDNYLAPYLRLAHDGEALQREMALRMTERVRITDEHATSQSQPQWFDAHGQTLAESWQLTASLRAYPWEAPVGLGIGGNAMGTYGQAWEREDRAYLDDGVAYGDRSDDHDYDHHLEVTASAGLGRVRNATVVQDVHVMERHLRETGAITRPLSARTRGRLARLLCTAPAFAAVHERPDRYVWREIERVLRDDGALAGSGLDTYSLMRARERALCLSPRWIGWFAGPVLGASHQHSIVRREWHQSRTLYDGTGGIIGYASGLRTSRVVHSEDAVNLGARLEYHRPVGWHWQFDAQSQITTPVSPDDDGLDLVSSASAQWMVADRWEAVASVSHSRNWQDVRDRQPYWTNDWTTNCGLQLGWYVEDHVQITASLSSSQYHSEYRYFESGWYRSFARNTGFSLGLTYRFLGRLDAPGLVEAVRPMP